MRLMRIAIVGNGKMGKAVARAGAQARGHTHPHRDRRGGECRRPSAHGRAAGGRRRRHRVHPARRGGGQPGAAHRGRHPHGDRHDRLERAAARGSRRWSSGAAARCSTPPTSRSACTSSSAPRATWPGASPGSRSSTPLYWRSITPPSSTRRRARRASSRRRREPRIRRAPFPITSVRAGATPGTHLVAYDGPYESVTLAHVARSREGFAAGALAAAEWLPGPSRRLHGRGHAVRRERMTRFEGCGTALVTPFTEDGARRLPGASGARRVADRRRHRLPRALRLHRRGPDAGRRASASRSWPPSSRPPPGGCRSMAGATSNDTRRAVDETRRMCAPRRRRHPQRHALLQQAHAGGPLPPLPGRRRRLHPAGLPLQRPRPHRRQPPARHRAPAGRAPERARASRRRAATSSRSWRSSATGPRASPCSRATTGWPSPSSAAGGDGLISVTSNEVPGADDRAGAPRARRRPRRGPQLPVPPPAAHGCQLPRDQPLAGEGRRWRCMGRIRDVLRLPLVPARPATRDALRAALAAAGAHVR